MEVDIDVYECICVCVYSFFYFILLLLLFFVVVVVVVEGHNDMPRNNKLINQPRTLFYFIHFIYFIHIYIHYFLGGEGDGLYLLSQ